MKTAESIFVRRHEVATTLGVGLSVVDRLTRGRQLDVVRLGQRVALVKRESFEALVGGKVT